MDVGQKKTETACPSEGREKKTRGLPALSIVSEPDPRTGYSLDCKLLEEVLPGT